MEQESRNLYGTTSYLAQTARIESDSPERMSQARILKQNSTITEKTLALASNKNKLQELMKYSMRASEQLYQFRYNDRKPLFLSIHLRYSIK